MPRLLPAILAAALLAGCATPAERAIEEAGAPETDREPSTWSWAVPAGTSWQAFRVHATEAEGGGYQFRYRVDSEETASRLVLFLFHERDELVVAFTRTTDEPREYAFLYGGVPSDSIVLVVTKDAAQPATLRLSWSDEAGGLDGALPRAPDLEGVGALYALYDEEPSGTDLRVRSFGVTVDDSRGRPAPTPRVAHGGELRVSLAHELGREGFHYCEGGFGAAGVVGLRAGALSVRGQVGDAPVEGDSSEPRTAGRRVFWLQGYATSLELALRYAPSVEVDPSTGLECVSIPVGPEELGLRVETGLWGLEGGASAR